MLTLSISLIKITSKRRIEIQNFVILNQLNTYLLLYNGFSNNKRHKISVLTSFEGTYFKNYKLHYAFSYQITIENNSKDTVQLVTRHWEIFFERKKNEIVDGEGVIGKTSFKATNSTTIAQAACYLRLMEQ
jgi:hypothetical protein